MLAPAHVRSSSRRYARERLRRGTDDDTLTCATLELKADPSRSEVQRDPPERLQEVRAKQQGGLVAKPEQFEGRHVGEGHRHIVQNHRPSALFVGHRLEWPYRTLRNRVGGPIANVRFPPILQRHVLNAVVRASGPVVDPAVEAAEPIDRGLCNALD